MAVRSLEPFDIVRRVVEAPESVRALVLVAHPDDETIGAGSLLGRLAAPLLVHLTDGAPRAGEDGKRAGFPRRQDYAAVRSAELQLALQLAGLDDRQRQSMGWADQEAAHHLVAGTYRLAGLLTSRRPDVLLTHPYEGGHPDHDAAAFIAWAATALLCRAGEAPTPVVEMAFYHRQGEQLRTSCFLETAGEAPGPVYQVALTPGQHAHKRRMLRCFETQQEVLAPFAGARHECFRLAPRYDFSRPPHPPPLHYETLNWRLDGAAFRREALRAAAALELVLHRS